MARGKPVDYSHCAKLTGLVAKRVATRRLRMLIPSFLMAGMLACGLVCRRIKGMPTGRTTVVVIPVPDAVC